MNRKQKQLLAFLLLAVVLVLCGCGEKPPAETTLPTEPPTQATESLSPMDIYAAACQTAAAAPALTLNIQQAETRFIGTETFQTQANISASYTDCSTDGMEALIEESLTFGTYTTRYTQSYLGGRAYAKTGEACFTAGLTPTEFMAQQIPAVLLDQALYKTILPAQQEDGGYLYTFLHPAGPEAWTGLPDTAQLTQIGATALVDAQGLLTEFHYQIQYTLGDISCRVDVTSVLSYPTESDLSARQPNYPENCPELTAFQAPKLLLRAVGCVYTFRDISAIQTETSYCEAAAVVRTQELLVDTWGSGENFMAQADYTVSLKNYANTTTSNTQLETFRDGKYVYSINGGEPTYKDSITAQQMRSYCEDSMLTPLLTMEHLTGATVVDAGEYYSLQMTCSDDLAQSIFTNILKLLNLDLNSFAQSISTDTGTAYLTVSKHTGLPVSMGQSFTQTHVIDGVAYRTTYQVDQTLSLPSSTAYGTITGEVTEETEPAVKATPLLYKVTGKKGQTLWLFGTIHIGDNRTGWLPQEVYDAFAASTTLAVEFDSEAFQLQTNTDPLLQSQLSKVYYYADGSATAAHLNPQLYQRAYALILASGSNTMNVPYMKPIIWESMLQNFYIQRDGRLTAWQGVDSRLLALARQQEKTVSEIESGLSQLQVLSGLPDAVQELLLRETASASQQDYCQTIHQLYEAWCRGDEAELTQAVLDDTGSMTEAELALYDQYYQAVITDRNATMLKAAKQFLKGKEPVFFAVGMAHILGEKGLAAQLQDAGYTVEIVTYQG